MRIALVIIAILVPGFSPAQDNVWSLEVLERAASWRPACLAGAKLVGRGGAQAGSFICAPVHKSTSFSGFGIATQVCGPFASSTKGSRLA